jgi:hypothetical protein
MEALDELTLRRRRERMLNPIMGELAQLEQLMFVYTPPSTPSTSASSYMEEEEMKPDDLTGHKRGEPPVMQYGDDAEYQDYERQRVHDPERPHKRKDPPIMGFGDDADYQDYTRQRVQSNKRKEVPFQSLGDDAETRPNVRQRFQGTSRARSDHHPSRHGNE